MAAVTFANVGVPAAWIGGALIAAFAVFKAWPSVWQFLLLPSKIEVRLHKLDTLDQMRDQQTVFLDEWQGAINDVRTLAGDHESRILSLEGRVSKVEHRLDEFEAEL